MNNKEFKTSAFGTIPSDWSVSLVNEIVEKAQSGGTPKSTEKDYYNGNIPFLSISDLTIQGKYIRETTKSITDSGLNESSAWLVPINSIIYSMYASVGFVSISKIPLATSQAMLNLIIKDGFDVEYIYYYLDQIRGKLKKYISTGTQGNLNAKTVRSFEIAYPSLSEQQKISQILSTQDFLIGEYGQLLKLLSKRRLGLEKQLFSKEIRFKDFTKNNKKIDPKNHPTWEWTSKHICKVVDRIKKPFSPEPETLYREIGIRSHCKGIFHKEEVTGASLGNKSVFWIQPDCFVVNIVFAWEHAIAKTTEAEVGMIASHRFPMYKPKKGILDLDYLLYYFKTARGKHLLGLASPGGAGRNKTLGQGEFAKLKIPVPSLAEQKRIVSVLSEADREIELLKQQIATLKEQKKGLMQKLLTGEIRTI